MPSNRPRTRPVPLRLRPPWSRSCRLSGISGSHGTDYDEVAWRFSGARPCPLTKTAMRSLGRRQPADDACRMSIGLIPNGIESPNLPGPGATSGANIASVNGQIRQDKQQLDDWSTCVSAKTSKGQAEIQRLSSELSAAQERAHRLAALQPQAAPAAPSRSIDVWA